MTDRPSARPIREQPGATFNPYVHGARGLFAMMVFVFHIAHSRLPSFAFAATAPVELALTSLQYGVELFFGISGIVIIGALARSPTLGAFAWDRATRIFPVLWISIVVILLLGLVAGVPPAARTIGHWVANLLPAPPFILVPLINPPAWSLGYEIFFYMLAAFVWWWRPRGLMRAVVWAVGILLLAAFPRAMLMLSGVLIARQMATGRRVHGLHRWPGVALVAFLLCWRGAAWMEWRTMEDSNLLGIFYVSGAAWVASAPLMILGGLFGTLALIGIHEGRGLLARILATRPLLWLGTVSYSFYLWHPTVLAVVKRGPGMARLLDQAGPAAQLVLFLLALPVVLVVSWASQRLIEVRLTRWLRRFGPAKPPGPVERVLAPAHGDVR
ncbi:MAG TPA: acyltransferase [Sphingomonas sp.]|jgi:peptidoglycan/LPS O-acetylase OafA/YrhL|uniref:acyltransferase family protein n=1 Tax=Sphingomonas sp. TaxID=28214 RepID=UPI002EDB7F0D